jgi:ferredoxin-type protein NapH
MKTTTLRRVTLILVVTLAVAGLIFHTGTGTPSSFGWSYIASICPLGVVEAALASKLLLPRALVVLLALVIAAVLLGKVFCAWVCPIPPLRRFFLPKKKAVVLDAAGSGDAVPDLDAAGIGDAVPALAEGGNSSNANAQLSALSEQEKASLVSSKGCESGCASCVEKRKKLDSRHIVLGGALISTVIFGFPVFCLVCPVGLVFATLIALWRFVGFSEPSWMLLVFPAIVLLEILVLRKWCLKWCPLGAVMSLMSLPNRFFRPKVDQSKCLRYKGVECTTCVDACEERLDPHYSVGMHECTKCGLCKDLCPSAAISIPFKPQKKNIEVIEPAVSDKDAA